MNVIPITLLIIAAFWLGIVAGDWINSNDVKRLIAKLVLTRARVELLEDQINEYDNITSYIPGDTLAQRLNLLLLSYNLSHSEYKDS